MNRTKLINTLENVAINLVSEALTSAGKVHYKEGAKKSIFGRPFTYKGGKWVSNKGPSPTTTLAVPQRYRDFVKEARKHNLPYLSRVFKAIRQVHKNDKGSDFNYHNEAARNFVTHGRIDKGSDVHKHPVIQQARKAYKKLSEDSKNVYEGGLGW